MGLPASSTVATTALSGVKRPTTPHLVLRLKMIELYSYSLPTLPPLAYYAATFTVVRLH